MRSVNLIKLVALPICASLFVHCADSKASIELSSTSAVASGNASLPPAQSAPVVSQPSITPQPSAGGTTPLPNSDNAESNPPALDNFKLTAAAFKNLQPYSNQDAAKSPELSWTGQPTGAGTFAIQIVDIDAVPPLVLWTITNIPATSDKIPAGIPVGNNLLEPKEAEGADQPNPYTAPVAGAEPHRIEVTLYAVTPNIGLRIGKDAAANKVQLEGRSVGKTVVTGLLQ